MTSAARLRTRGARCSCWPGPGRGRPARWWRGQRGCAARASRPAGSCCSPSPAGPPTTCLPASRRAPAGGARIWGGRFPALGPRTFRGPAESFSLPAAFSVIDPADVTDILDTLREEHGLVGLQRRAPRAPVCGDVYTRCVSTHATVADVVQASFPWCADFTDQLAGLFRGYV